MLSMKQLSLPVLVLAALVAGQAASAQVLLPGTPLLNPPPPIPPPPPKIAVPKVPQLDAPPSYNFQPIPRTSFGDRIARCLDEAAGAGLSPADRDTYARSCAN
ncbi:hypothetical protein AYJ54_10810 [Bradyrhizobium centrolobii]|uniref:UrcA family protein n=1 Tax=Bradyrhizobium centrolobii TaxID=1505087 RepID=A0A176YU68_9BRAD|nr:hypothetical protein [Bradyrhizobium centrolobii]OAF10341.1 hypothetical protein AYJ54_10810 [Bradyrhizobium centrolobii]